MSKHIRLACHALGWAMLAGNSLAQNFTSLPVAPSALPAQAQATFYLTLVVNGRPDQEIVPVILRENRYFVEAGVLARNHVRIGSTSSGLVNLDTLSQVNTRYDSARQQLHLTVPNEWLPRQDITTASLLHRHQARSSFGLLQNYDMYYFKGYDSTTSVSTWLEQRVFTNVGYLTNTGTYRMHMQQVQNGDTGYLRYDTFWRYSDESRMVSVQAGDFISNALTWSTANRMGGLRISRQFGVRPDLVTYPLLQYSGTASLPSSIDLFINGYKAGSSSINAGPYTLNNIPYISGQGEAVIVTTDALGRQVEVAVPFYVSNQLLSKGLSDFDISVGVMRRRYGLDNASYGGAATSLIYRYGLNDKITLSTHAELSRELRLGGIGTDFLAGRWGTISAAYAMSNSNADQRNRTGHQYMAGYTFYSNAFSVTAQHSRRSAGYEDLSSVNNASTMRRQINQFTFSTTPFGKNNGTMGIGYFDLQDQDNKRTRLFNMSYSIPLRGNSNVNVSLNKTIGSGYSANIQWSIPLGSNNNVGMGVQRDDSGNTFKRINASRAIPSHGGLGWGLGYAVGGGEHNRHGELGWMGKYATVKAGVYGNQGQENYWGNLSGAFIWMDNAVFATNKINDAFIVVSTEGYKDVTVLYENQVVGKTSKSGHALIPWVSAYHPGQVDIATMDLPVDVQTPTVEQRVAVRESSGTVVSFPVYKVRPAMLRLIDAHGGFIPLGSKVHVLGSRQYGVVGHDGLTYFSHLQRHNQIVIDLPNNEYCQLDVHVPDDSAAIAEIGPLSCLGPAPPIKEMMP